MRKPATQWARARLAIQRVCRDERGVTAIEYALLGSLVALAVVVGAMLVGNSVATLYGDVATVVGAL